jgi:hypothetical protein
MRIKDVPTHPAYVVFHDSYDNGAMDVYGCESLERAQAIAAKKQASLDDSGYDEAGIWKAYEKLPRIKVYSYHGEIK